MFGIIYIITNLINGKVYIGLTILTLKDRWYGHCRRGTSKSETNMRIKRAIFKYGKENFTIKELEKCNIEDLDNREIYYINLYDSINTGYNVAIGGKHGNKPLKLSVEELKTCIELYKLGFSIRDVAKEYNVDKGTIKHIIEINNIPLRTTRTYKLSLQDRINIIEDSKYLTRKEIIDKWKISKGYLSELINGKRRI